MSDQIVLSLDRVLALIRQGLLLALLMAALVGGAVYGYTRRLAPSYSARAVVTVSPTGFDSGKYDLPSVTVPPLHVTAYRIATLSDELIGGALRSLSESDTPGGIERLRERTAISTDDRAQLVYIAVTGGSAAGAAKTANALAAQLVAWDAGRTNAALHELIDVLTQRSESNIVELLTLSGQDPATSARLTALQAQQAQTLADIGAAQKLTQNPPGSVTLLQAASAPLTTVAPTPLFSAALAALIAFALVYAALLVREVLDPRIYGAEDALRATRLPLLGLFPAVRNPNLNGYAVGFGAILHDSLRVSSGNANPNAVQVTGIVGGEGAMAVAAALAEAATLRGNRTLLIDTDMVDPKLPRLYRQTGLRATSLSDYLGHPDMQYRANPIAIGQSRPLYVLYEAQAKAKGAPPLGHALKALLARWREEFDTVIVATSPWSSNQDSALVAPLVDCTVLVTNGQRVRKRLALGQIGAIRRVGGRVLGLVITQTRRDDPAAVVAASDDLALVTPTTEPNTTTP